MMLLDLLVLLVVAFAKAQVPELHLNHQGFSDDLTELLYAATPENDNDCTSSLGVSMAFSLVYPSATGDAKTQIQTTLGYPTSDDDDDELVWSNATMQLNRGYKGTCFDDSCNSAEPLVSIANSVWIDDSATLNPEYSSTVGDLLFPIDFNSDTAGSLVNEWVNDKSRGKIPSIVPDAPLSPLILLAVNTIYLKASWSSQFDTFRTSEDIFYESASRTTVKNQQAHFMHKLEYYEYTHEAIPGYQILKLPFSNSGNALSMIVVLPTAEGNPKVSSTDLIEDALPNLQRQRIALALPKFELKSTYQATLKQALQDLGMTAPFESGALCIYVNDCSAFIDFIVQKTFISLDEEGVEAAAVTAIASVTSFPVDRPTEFLADHTFQFFIYEEATELVLFEGAIGNPEPQDSSVAQFTPQHTDGGFWRNSFGLSEDPIVPDPVQVSSNKPNAPTTTEGGTTTTTDSPTTEGSTTTPGAPEEPSFSDTTKSTSSALVRRNTAAFTGVLCMLLIVLQV